MSKQNVNEALSDAIEKKFYRHRKDASTGTGTSTSSGSSSDAGSGQGNIISAFLSRQLRKYSKSFEIVLLILPVAERKAKRQARKGSL